MEIINLKGISKIYGTKSNSLTALDNIDLKINKGEFVSIIGSSGSGKSTLLNIIGCLDRPTSGEYNFNNTNLSKLNDKKISMIRNKTFGFVLQFFGLINDENVFQNVKVPLDYSNKKDKKNLIQEVLSKLGISDKIKCKPTELSGGQCQRVAIARALVNNPDIILADEPTGALDSKTGQQVIDIFKQLNNEGKTVIIVTHDNNIAIQCKRIIKIEDGKIISDITNCAEAS